MPVKSSCQELPRHFGDCRRVRPGCKDIYIYIYIYIYAHTDIEREGELYIYIYIYIYIGPALQVCRTARSRTALLAEASRRRRRSGASPGRTWAGPALPGVPAAQPQVDATQLQGPALRTRRPAAVRTALQVKASRCRRRSGGSPGRTRAGPALPGALAAQLRAAAPQLQGSERDKWGQH